MDFGKIAIILSQINTDALDLEDVEYLPSDFWVDFEDGLGLADFVAGGWGRAYRGRQVTVRIGLAYTMRRA